MGFFNYLLSVFITLVIIFFIWLFLGYLQYTTLDEDFKTQLYNLSDELGTPLVVSNYNGGMAVWTEPRYYYIPYRTVSLSAPSDNTTSCCEMYHKQYVVAELPYLLDDKNKLEILYSISNSILYDQVINCFRFRGCCIKKINCLVFTIVYLDTNYQSLYTKYNGNVQSILSDVESYYKSLVVTENPFSLNLKNYYAVNRDQIHQYLTSMIMTCPKGFSKDCSTQNLY